MITTCYLNVIEMGNCSLDCIIQVNGTKLKLPELTHGQNLKIGLTSKT